MKKLLLSVVAAMLMGSFTMQAQQDPQYTQYMYNQNVINPAYAGTNDLLTVTSLYRQQWSGVNGAPETFTLAGSSPIGNNVGVGLSFISDQLGPFKEQNVYGDFSYRLRTGKSTTLALGLKAGVSFYQLGDVQLLEPNDPLNETFSESSLNLGAGAFFYSDNYYVGFSVPNMLNATHLDDNGRNIGNETQHYFLTGGYVFDLSESVKFKPHFLVKGAFESPVSFDINTNFLFSQRVELGVSYRYEDSFSGLIGFYLTQNIRMGYAYDRVVSDISFASQSSHEVFLSFDLSFPRRVMQSPRFF